MEGECHWIKAVNEVGLPSVVRRFQSVLVIVLAFSLEVLVSGRRRVIWWRIVSAFAAVGRRVC